MAWRLMFRFSIGFPIPGYPVFKGGRLSSLVIMISSRQSGQNPVLMKVYKYESVLLYFKYPTTMQMRCPVNAYYVWVSFFTRKANDHEGTLLSREQGLTINPCRNKAHLPGFLLPAARF
jgi:hypothetical protein